MSDAVVPRWEWRWFGEDLGAAGDRLAALSPERGEETDELYLLSANGGVTVKVRAGLLDGSSGWTTTGWSSGSRS